MNKNNSINSRIKKSLLGLSFMLSLIFGLVTFLLLYVIEDQVFINLLKAENKQYKQLDSIQAKDWQPSNHHMKLIHDKSQMSEKLQAVVSSKKGVYEYFENDQAYFILHGKNKQAASYYITFDVNELLVVREGRFVLISTIIVVTLLVMIMAILVSLGLSKKILAPLKKLTNQLQNNGLADMSKGFSKPFVGDEVGVLTSQLEQAVEETQSAIQREFEFNSGVSHELRTPIQVAINSVELLELTQKDLKDSKVLHRLKRAIIQMQQTSEAFLWLASQKSFEKDATNPLVVLKTLKKQYDQQYPKQSLSIHSHLEDFSQYVVPRSVFTVIIDNLLRNAYQHGEGEEIEIKLKNDSFHISNLKPTSDNQSATDTQKAHGIGLMIVERICQRLNWQLNINDNNSEYFTIEIRLATQS